MVLTRWRRAAPEPAPRRPPAVPEGQRIYAVGDIHGRSDLLEAMAGLIARDLATRPGPEATTIFLGDYVDRGPESSKVIDQLVRGDFPTPIVTLRGNHEEILSGLLTGDVDVAYHDQLGGSATLASYGLDSVAYAWASKAERAVMIEAIPLEHCDFLDGLWLSETVGDYFFCHAGARPGIALDRQSAEDLMWIRDDFLRSSYDFGKVIVHGHTPARTPLVRPNGIGIDTHAFASGILTALVLEGPDRRFLHTRA